MSLHATLIHLAHARLDRADALLAACGATIAVLEAYSYAAHAFKLARVPSWATLATERAERVLEVL